jgi:hypothetical protein
MIAVLKVETLLSIANLKEFQGYKAGTVRITLALGTLQSVVAS